MTQGWVYGDKMFILWWTISFTLQIKHLWMQWRVLNKQLSVKRAGQAYASNLNQNSVVATINTEQWHSGSTFNFTSGKGICAVTKPSAMHTRWTLQGLSEFISPHCKSYLHPASERFHWWSIISLFSFLVLTPHQVGVCTVITAGKTALTKEIFPGMRNYMCSQTVHNFPIWVEIKRVFPI